ncbi:ABC transporter permease [Verrucosispora sp. WMMD703]|uniref:Glycine/betaine ABC transporter permease n=1 Tax=Micromonospora sediminimaris TaxID=547162 RepID=A0A9W5UVQ1_9ACTN|nr:MULTISPECIES: ABC transporter permease [Micromonospora]WFE46069.1 ABC transporter permease [Verrucosispora sp. WMMD1129]GIJ34110.1 glycine/betaine ABC transporter permease [Micromonospora sediminimaris]SFD56316.1 osmoprotectant transport system permease protein [Micromonospora sediminimaris]
MSFRLSYRADPGNPWFSWQYVRDNSETVLNALREHTTLTLRAVLIAALIAVPLAVVAYWFRPLTGPILALTGVLYTVPSLALFAFVAPYLGIGVATVLSVVVLYALLVIVRNTVAGLNQVPAEVREAAEGMGYGRWGRLLRIELPLALPGILTGLRLATVSTVALVTVGVVIGRGGLGQIIFAGFQNNLYKAQIMTGTLLCVLLALVLDLLLVGAGRLLTPWLRGRTG